jgi:acyl-CoA thioester hydrolase
MNNNTIDTMQGMTAIPIRVYYENTDAGGVVYHGEYLRFWERARTEFLRHKGFSHQVLASLDDKLLFVVRKMTVDYLKPLFLDDYIQATAQIIKKGNASVVFEQKIIRDTELIAIAQTVCVSIGEDKKPKSSKHILKDL